jgi:hypothetical protein
VCVGVCDHAVFVMKQWMDKKAEGNPGAVAEFFKVNGGVDIDTLDYLTEESVTEQMNEAKKKLAKQVAKASGVGGAGGAGGSKSGGGMKRKADA